QGQSWFGIGREIGLPGQTVPRLCEAAPGFVAVEVVDAAIARDLVVVAPTGYRVEGLDDGGGIAGAARVITLPRTVWAYGRPVDLRKGYNGGRDRGESAAGGSDGRRGSPPARRGSPGS